jgi:hypothetical protein
MQDIQFMLFSLTCYEAQDFNNSGTLWRNVFAHMLTVDQLDENSNALTVFLKPILILFSPLHPVFQVFPFFHIFRPKFCINFSLFFPYILFIFVVSHFLQIIWFIRLQFIASLAVPS